MARKMPRFAQICRIWQLLANLRQNIKKSIWLPLWNVQGMTWAHITFNFRFILEKRMRKGKRLRKNSGKLQRITEIAEIAGKFRLSIFHPLCIYWVEKSKKAARPLMQPEIYTRFEGGPGPTFLGCFCSLEREKYCVLILCTKWQGWSGKTQVIHVVMNREGCGEVGDLLPSFFFKKKCQRCRGIF